MIQNQKVGDMKDTETYNADRSDIGWLENELKHINFKDKRLVDRLIKTANLLDSKASGTINQSCRSQKDSKGVYRLVSNAKFDIDDREADIFKFLWKIEESSTGFVIGNRQDRKFICFETGKTKIQTKIRDLESKKVFKFEISGNGNQKAREANIEV